jgi:hypothetical protein
MLQTIRMLLYKMSDGWMNCSAAPVAGIQNGAQHAAAGSMRGGMPRDYVLGA